MMSQSKIKISVGVIIDRVVFPSTLHIYPYHGEPMILSISENGTVPGHVVQSVIYLATDASLAADPGVESLIPARSHTFVEIDHVIISTVILLPSAESFKKGCCQLQVKVYAQSTG